jgi:hypothetical protein
MAKRALLLLSIIFTPAFAQSDAGPGDRAEWQNEEIVIRGDYFHAAMVAYEDFKRLRARQSTPANGAGDPKFADYMSNINNFNLKVAAGGTRYIVWINPRGSREFPVIFGGDALYILDSSTFKVVEKHYGK